MRLINGTNHKETGFKHLIISVDYRNLLCELNAKAVYGKTYNPICWVKIYEEYLREFRKYNI